MQDGKEYPVIILNRTQMGENAGFAARSMKNFGFSRLRFINPGLKEDDQWEAKANNEAFDLKEFIKKATDVAKGGGDVIHDSEVYNSLEGASHDLERIYALSARRRHIEKEVITPQAFIKEAAEFDGKIGILFGGEASGLSNNDISHSYKIIEIETNAECPSINLGISVAIMCHLMFSNLKEEYFTSRQRKVENLASPADISYLMKLLEEKLMLAGYFKVPEKRPAMMINIKNIFSRGNLTKAECKTLFGIFSLIASSPE